MKKHIPFVVFLCTLLMPLLAFAQEAQVVVQRSPWYLLLLDHTIDLVGAVILAVLTPLIIKLGTATSNKMGVENSQKLQTSMENIARSGVQFAEEWGHKKIKEGKTVSGDDKLSKATEFAVEQIQKYGLDDKLLDLVSKSMHAALHIQRPPSTPPTPGPSEPEAPSAPTSNE